jgi:hypothetical protein
MIRDQLLSVTDRSGKYLGSVSVLDGKVFALLPGGEPGIEVASIDAAVALLTNNSNR